MTKSNENREFSNSFCPSVRPGCSLAPSPSNVVEGALELTENPIIDKETLPTTSVASFHVLKQATDLVPYLKNKIMNYTSQNVMS